MSYGAPGEQGVGEADPTPLLSLDEPGLVPGASGSILGAKKAQKGRYQRNKRRRLRKEAAARKVRCLNDQDRCMGMMAEEIEENRREMVCVSRVVDQFEETFCSDLGKLRSEVRKEMAKEKNNMLVAMSSLSKLWKLLAAKGLCLDDAIGAVESVCDCGVGSRDGTELAATDDATMPFSSSMWDDVKVDDVGEGVVLGDAFAVFGDCGVEFDVIGEGRLADVLQERDGTGGSGGSLRMCGARCGSGEHRW